MKFGSGILLRIVCVAGLLLLLFWIFPAEVEAQYSYTTNSDHTITITAYTGSEGAVIIPIITNGLSVTTIGDNAFQDCQSLTSVTIPGSVTNIGDGRSFSAGA